MVSRLTLTAALLVLASWGAGCTHTPATVSEALAPTPTDQFYHLVKDAGGVEATLAEAGPYTVFAPKDEALAQASGQVEELKRSPERLRSAVLSHVVKDEGLSLDDLKQRSTLTMMNGKTVSVTTSGDRVTVGGATIVGPPVKAKNGVVYPVDRLVTP